MAATPSGPISPPPTMACRPRCAVLSSVCAASTDTCRGRTRNPAASTTSGSNAAPWPVTVHAGTGERVLFISPSDVKSIVGLTPRESQKLRELFWEHATRPEYTVRFKWNAGDIAFWDNRSTSHLAPTDIFQSDFDRQLYRITLVGEPLVGVDGRPSTAIEGLPILSAAEELRTMAAE